MHEFKRNNMYHTLIDSEVPTESKRLKKNVFQFFFPPDTNWDFLLCGEWMNESRVWYEWMKC